MGSGDSIRIESRVMERNKGLRVDLIQQPVGDPYQVRFGTKVSMECILDLAKYCWLRERAWKETKIPKEPPN